MAITVALLAVSSLLFVTLSPVVCSVNETEREYRRKRQ